MITPAIAQPVDPAQAHDKWMHAQIEQALVEADDPNTVWLRNEEVKARSAVRRAKFCAENQPIFHIRDII